MAQMRFQPRAGKYLAAAAENVVSILDVETQACRHSLQVSLMFPLTMWPEPGSDASFFVYDLFWVFIQLLI
jgi:hypothetical protein